MQQTVPTIIQEDSVQRKRSESRLSASSHSRATLRSSARSRFEAANGAGAVDLAQGSLQETEDVHSSVLF